MQYILWAVDICWNSLLKPSNFSLIFRRFLSFNFVEVFRTSSEISVKGIYFYYYIDHYIQHPILNLRILIFFHEICCLFWSVQNELTLFLSKKPVRTPEKFLWIKFRIRRFKIGRSIWRKRYLPEKKWILHNFVHLPTEI